MIRGFFMFCAAALVAALLSQFPEFFQQYTQRLGGRLDELNAQVQALDERAGLAGKTRYDYIKAFIDNKDADIRREGQHLTSMLGRQVVYEKAYTAMVSATPLDRPFRFANHFDSQIADATARDYKPAVPLTPEGGAYALVGFIIGAGVFALIFGRRKRRDEAYY